MSENPNPQGKGLSPILATLEESRAAVATVPPKHIEQVSTELFTSLFVLESDFRFKPTPGRSYWLYYKRERFWLSLIPPGEWDETVYGRYIGECTLQPDMTWTLRLADEVTRDRSFSRFLEDKRAQFERRMQDAERVDDVLPVYEGKLAFYPRAFAFALAHSLGASMRQSGIQGLSYHEARGLLGDESGSVRERQRMSDGLRRGYSDA